MTVDTILKQAETALEVARERIPPGPNCGLPPPTACLTITATALKTKKTVRLIRGYLKSKNIHSIKSNGWWVWIYFMNKKEDL